MIDAKPYSDLIVDQDRATVEAELGRAVSEQDGYRLTYRIHHRDGGIRWIWEQGSSIADQNGNTVAFEGFAADITDRIQIEEALEQARQEADRANQSKSRFLAGVSHELRTPMNSILGFSELLLRRDPRIEQREYLVAIVGAGRTLLRLIEDILDISAAESGEFTLDPQACEVKPLLEAAVASMRPEAERHRLKVKFTHLGEPSALLLDGGRLRQILPLGKDRRHGTHRGTVPGHDRTAAIPGIRPPVPAPCPCLRSVGNPTAAQG